ncbi:MAG TPA: HEAT repeat domain-containing protein [Gemmatimonadales bacterium]|nr:HEAT repeat domain-containing protein [Gemmatimonadales bacterium]
MAAETAGVERALGAIGTTFRLTRLYPPSHPAVMEALRQIGETVAPLAALGTIEWKVGVSGVHWHGQHLLPRNAQIAQLAGLLYARGVRAVTLNPGMTPDHILALFHVATGALPHDDTTLGRITLGLGRRSATRLERLRAPTPGQGTPAIPDPEASTSEASPPPPERVTAPPPVLLPAPPPSFPAPHPSAVVPAAHSAESLLASRRASAAFRPDVLPIDVEVKRAVAALGTATTPDEQRAAVEKLGALATQLLGMHDVAIAADAIAALDRLLPTVQDPAVLSAIDQAAVALSDRTLVERLVHRLGEGRVPPAELESVVAAVGALASLSMGLVLDAFVAAPVELRAPYRATVRAAADRALEPLQGKLADREPAIVAAAAEFLGVTGSPQAVSLLLPLVRHGSEYVREAALLGLAEAGGREISRPAMPALKDESVAVRAAAARAVAAGGDPASSTVLIRRMEQEPDEGVQAELLRAIGRLASKEALEVLAKYAEPGGMMSRRSPMVRAAAVDGLRHLTRPEARGLLELYSKDKEPAVRKAAEAALK